MEISSPPPLLNKNYFRFAVYKSFSLNRMNYLFILRNSCRQSYPPHINLRSSPCFPYFFIRNLKILERKIIKAFKTQDKEAPNIRLCTSINGRSTKRGGGGGEEAWAIKGKSFILKTLFLFCYNPPTDIKFKGGVGVE